MKKIAFGKEAARNISFNAPNRNVRNSFLDESAHKSYDVPPFLTYSSWMRAIEKRETQRRNKLCKNYNYFSFECDSSSRRFRNKMNIPVVQEDGTENEFELDICCDNCAYKEYQWQPAQFIAAVNAITNGSPIKVPNSIDSVEKFKEFIRAKF